MEIGDLELDLWYLSVKESRDNKDVTNLPFIIVVSCT